MKNLKSRLSLVLVFVLALALSLGFSATVSADAVSDARANVLTYEGMLARTTGASGIRSLFSIDKQALATLEESGYTVEIGASMAAAKVGDREMYSVSDLSVVADSEKGYVSTQQNVATVVVYSSNKDAAYATNMYVSETASTYKFAFTTLFSEAYETSEYYTAEFCYRGFIALTKDGATEIVYADAKGSTFGDSISLYEIVSYFVSGNYTGDKAEEYANLDKFHKIVDAVESVTPEEPTVLPAPTLTVAPNSDRRHADLSWTEVEGADAYRYAHSTDNDSYTIFATPITKLSTRSANANGKWFKVQAVKLVDGTVTEEGAWSNAVRYTMPDQKKLDTPEITVTYTSRTTATVSWTKIDVATKYEYTINGESTTTTNNALVKLELNVGDTFTVQALGAGGDGAHYTNSDVATATLATPEVTKLSKPVLTITPSNINVGKVTWEAIPGASGYLYSIYTVENGERVYSKENVLITTTSVAQLSKQNYIVVKAVGDNDLYLNSEDSDPVIYIPPVSEQLATPVVTIDPATGIASWEAIPNAKNYSVTITGGAETRKPTVNTDDTSLQIYSVQLYDGESIQVQAIGDNLYFTHSAYSTKVGPYVDPNMQTLATPVVTVDRNGIVSWTNVDNASGYKYQIGKDVFEADGTVITLTYGQSITVMALGDGENYRNSDWSLVVTYNAPAAIATPVVTVDGETGVATWTADANATKYVYIVNDGEPAETTETSVTLKNGDTIKVMAIGDGDLHLDSEYSEVVTCVIKTKLAAPTLLTVERHPTDRNYAVLTWTAVEDAKYYIYAYSTDGGDTFTEKNKNGTSQSVLVDLNNTTGYIFWVKAVGDGTTTANSERSNELTYMVPAQEKLATPVLTVTYVSKTQATVSWDSVANAGGYAYTVNDGEVQTLASKYTSITVDFEKSAEVKVWATYTEGEKYYFVTGDADTVTLATPKATKLPTPDVTVTPNVGRADVSWAAIPGATGYTYQITDENGDVVDVQTVTKTSCAKILSPNCTIQVTALGDGEGGLYLNSDPSASKTYIPPVAEVLPIPEVTFDPATGIASWDAVPHAVKYQYRITDADGKVIAQPQTTALFIQLEAGQKIEVRALGDTVYYAHGTFSAKVGYEAGGTPEEPDEPDLPTPVTLTAPVVTVDGETGVATWTAVANATGYKYVINDGEPVKTTETSVTLNNGDTIKVMAIGDGDLHLDSEYSAVVTCVIKTKLAAPTLTATTDGTNRLKVTFTWTAVDGASKYKYAYSTDNGTTYTEKEVSTFTYTMTNTANCWFKVMALGNGTTTANSEWAVISYTAPAKTPLATPELTVTLIDSKTATVSWTEVANAQGYAYTVNGGEVQTLASNVRKISPVNVGDIVEVWATYKDVETYFYKNSAPATLTVELGNVEILATPTLTVTKHTTSRLYASLSWTAVDKAVKYTYAVSTDGGYTYKEFNANQSLGVNAKVTDDTEYLFKVKAVGDKTTTIDSEWSNAVCYTMPDQIKLDTPVLKVFYVSKTQATVSWDPVANAQGYAYTIGDGEPQSNGKVTSITVDFEKSAEVKVWATYTEGEAYFYCNSDVATATLATPEQTKLSKPEVSVALDGTASWTAIPGATSYNYVISGGAVKNTTKTSVKLTNGQTITVQAVGDGEGGIYEDSEWSTETDPYVAPVAIATPVVTLNGAVASWTADENATKYVYIINDDEPVETTETSVTLTSYGQTIKVMAIGDGGLHLDSAWSAAKTYKDPSEEGSDAVTEWTFDLTDSSQYTKAGNLTADANGVKFTQYRNSNYIEITINASVAGFYNFYYTGAAGTAAGQIAHVNTSVDGDLADHIAYIPFTKNTTQSDELAVTMYLKEDENVIRIYSSNNSYYVAKTICVSLNLADADTTKHVVVDKDNASDYFVIGGTGSNEPVNATYGNLYVRNASTVEFAIPEIAAGETGTYKVYVLGANNASSDSTITLLNGETTVTSYTKRPTENITTNYNGSFLYELGTIEITEAGADYALRIKPGGTVFGMHQLVLVKVG